ncbi:hypothetical protein [Cryptosporangium sp. NPDC051539]|uniref:hypothetical protein n=1 Tax=Cryptosporangium sp. NPDC051539 TaxID=3363962 RepID=UPI0037B506B6
MPDIDDAACGAAMVAAILTATLRELAGPALYQRNAFRITKLPTDADRRRVRRHRHGGPAFDVILDPSRRIVHELFWLWDTPTADCPCPATLHQRHDAAVRAHHEAIDGEAHGQGESADELDARWSEAARAWRAQLDDPGFWEHVRHRGADDATIDLLRAELPAALVQPVVALTLHRPGLRRAALAWPAPRQTILDLLRTPAEPLYTAIEATLRDVPASLDAEGPAAAMSMLRQDALRLVRQLDVPGAETDGVRVSRLRNDLALAINDCALRLIAEEGAAAEKPARRWLSTAQRYASDPQTLALVTANFDDANEIVDRRRIRPLDEPRDRRPPLPRSWRRVRAVALLVLAAVATGWVVWGFHYRYTDDDTDPVTVIAGAADQIAPAGTCIATGRAWYDNRATVPSVDCGEQHWGEILGSVHLTRWSSYPGDDAVQQEVNFECLWMLADQGLVDHFADGVWPGEDRWNSGARYAGCALHRFDDSWLPRHRLVDPHRRPATDTALSLSLGLSALPKNPPVGACISDRAQYFADLSRVRFTRCARSHWGAILGYPILYGPSERLPKPATVSAAAREACGTLFEQRGLGPEYTYNAVYPTPGQRGGRKYAVCVVSRADNENVVGAFDRAAR